MCLYIYVYIDVLADMWLVLCRVSVYHKWCILYTHYLQPLYTTTLDKVRRTRHQRTSVPQKRYQSINTQKMPARRAIGQIQMRIQLIQVVVGTYNAPPDGHPTVTINGQQTNEKHIIAVKTWWGKSNHSEKWCIMKPSIRKHTIFPSPSWHQGIFFSLQNGFAWCCAASWSSWQCPKFL